jgi:hypothetical protein
MQQLKQIRPLSVNTDIDELLMKDTEARFLKNYRIGINVNDNLNTGTGDGAPQGSNFGKGTAIQSSTPAAAGLVLPEGKNQCIGSYECQETNELYWFNWNSNGNHGVYRLNGKDATAQVVYVNSCLNFSNDPKNSLDNRVYLKVVYGTNDEGIREITAKYLLFTDGNDVQHWIDVETSIATDGFNPLTFPYFAPVPPHFNSCDLISYNIIPPFFCPTWTIVPFTNTDAGKNNSLLNKSTQFAYQFIYRDGRTSVLSPDSVNLYINGNGCSELNTNNPRCADVVIGAGNSMVEKIRILFRNCGGNFFLYDTVDKYEKCATGAFYTRKISLPGYDPVTNTFVYRYCGDKECSLFSVTDAIRVQNDIPLKSYVLTPIGNSILLVNNLYGFDNFPCETLNNITATTSIATPVQGICVSKTVTIKVMATSAGTPIVLGQPDGDVVYSFISSPNIRIDYNAGYTHVANKKGLIGYLAGTPYATVGTQYVIDTAGVKTKVDILNFYDNNVHNSIGNVFAAGSYYATEFIFVVPAGNYVFRLASATTTLEDVDYQQTSTYVTSVANVRQMNPSNNHVLEVDNEDYTVKEILINACDGDVDVFAQQDHKMLIIRPPQLTNTTREKLFFGYVTDTDKVDKKGQELLNYIVNEGYPETIISGIFTDHNGFYFISVRNGGANNAEVQFWGEYNCEMTFQANAIIQTHVGRRAKGQKIFEVNLNIASVNAGVYKECNEVKVLGKIIDSSGNGVSGVNVVVTRGGSTLTNSAGEFTLKVHKGNARGIPNYLGVTILDYIVFNSIGGCAILSADCTCIPMQQYIQPPSNCSCTVPRIYPVTITRTVRYVSTAANSLKGGGRYGLAIVGRDGSGHQGFANNFTYVNVPTFLQTGVFQPTILTWSVTDDFVLPDWVKYVSFYRTKNLNFDTYIQWVGDKIQYLNARGEIILTTDEAVRAKITIQSLLDFNLQNNFATTVGYQFVPGDILRIYDNGDGELFKVDASNSFMDYPVLGSTFGQSITQSSTINNVVTTETLTGNSFIIAYDKRLNALKDKCSFWIEILRPHQCEDREIYYEICGTYAVENGKIAGGVKTGVLNTWDTYFQNRLIRPLDCAAKTFAHPFESNAITDFWGSGCDSNGRITVIDENAEQKWFGDDAIKSDDFANEGRINGLGTFRELNRKNFSGQDWGPIIAAHAERSIVCFICQNDWFLSDFNMNFLRTTPDGLIIANLDTNLGQPHQKVGYTWGCEFEDNATIIFDDGVAIWADRKNAGVVLMDYRGAGDISAQNNKSYFVTKFRQVIQANEALAPGQYLSNLTDIVAVKDPKNKEYIITFRPRRNNSADLTSFVNDERETHVDHQETFAFNLEQQEWVRFLGYTPEHYGVLRHSITGIEMITFANGLPYFMNNNSERTFDTFYGIETDQVITAPVNIDPAKVKIFQSVTVESNNMPYFLDLIFTDDVNSFSYVPLAYWQKREGIWYTELQRNMNTYPTSIKNDQVLSMLVDGKRIFGTFVMLRFVRDPNQRNGYNELNNIWMRFTGSERSES